MQIGDRMTAIPTELRCDVDNRTKKPIPMVGEVVFIHPMRRFYVLEFALRNGNKVREAYKFSIKERGQQYEDNSGHEREGWRRKNRNHRKHGVGSGGAVRKTGSGH